MEELRPASSADQGAIAALLQACDLPHQDIAAHLHHFTVACDGPRLVGVIGLEPHGRDGLLRSLAVEESRRGHGIARRLYATAIGEARRLGLEQLYALTASAVGFFEMLGFRAVPGDEVPDEIRATEEFRTLRQASATCMARVMPRA